MNVKRAVENQMGIFNMLKMAKSQNRMSHAYLFYGEEGTGKKEMAYALACLLDCPNGGDLTCPVCKTILDNLISSKKYSKSMEIKPYSF